MPLMAETDVALAGSELALLANLSPILLANRNIRIWTQSRSGLIWLRSSTAIFGLGCYAAPLPILRLVGVVIGTGTGWLAVLSPLMRIKGGREARAEAQGMYTTTHHTARADSSVLLVALAAATLLKHVNSSINPFWASADAASGGWNKTGLVIVALSIVELSNRSFGLFPGAPSAVKDKAIPTQPASIAVTAGFGALVHLIHTLATDAGTIIAWTWTGYPIKGPTLHPFGGAVLATIAFSSILSIDGRLAAGLAALGSVGLYAFPNWSGFSSGLIAIVGLISSLPGYLQTVSGLPPAHTLGWAMAIYGLLDVISVVTVAYAFVPLGNLVRERTDLVLGVSCLLIAAGTRCARPVPVSDRAERRIRRTNRYSTYSVILLAAVSVAHGCWKMPRTQPVPYSKHRIFSGGIWTVSCPTGVRQSMLE